MTLRNPEWLALLPVSALALWMGRRWQWHRPLRGALMGVLLAVLLGPQWRGGQSGKDLWVLLDRSASTEWQGGAVIAGMAEAVDRGAAVGVG